MPPLEAVKSFPAHTQLTAVGHLKCFLIRAEPLQPRRPQPWPPSPSPRSITSVYTVGTRLVTTERIPASCFRFTIRTGALLPVVVKSLLRSERTCSIHRRSGKPPLVLS